jgi:hypothetical protein
VKLRTVNAEAKEAFSWKRLFTKGTTFNGNRLQGCMAAAIGALALPNAETRANRTNVT